MTYIKKYRVGSTKSHKLLIIEILIENMYLNNTEFFNCTKAAIMTTTEQNEIKNNENGNNNIRNLQKKKKNHRTQTFHVFSSFIFILRLHKQTSILM